MLDIADYPSIDSKENREVLRFTVDNRFLVKVYKRKNVRFKHKSEEDYTLAFVESYMNSFKNKLSFYDTSAILNLRDLKINKNIGSIKNFHCKNYHEMGDYTLNFLINESFKQLGLDLVFELECTIINKAVSPDEPDEPRHTPSPLRFFDIFKRKKMK